MLIYVDDVLHIAEDPSEDMSRLSQIYRLEGDMGPPDRYLGDNVNKIQLHDDSVTTL